MEDKRVVPYFVRAAYSSNYSLKFVAMRVLGNFNSGEALGGLKKGMRAQASDFDRKNYNNEEMRQSSADQIRSVAAAALARSAHPEAQSLLISMRNDRYRGVRINVLHALGKMNSAESLEIIKEMTEDSNKGVRDEAMRYFKLRTERPATSRSE